MQNYFFSVGYLLFLLSFNILNVVSTDSVGLVNSVVTQSFSQGKLKWTDNHPLCCEMCLRLGLGNAAA